jgi:peptidoglycan/xylan/chitin deacetylase (PgdA/CDA1 family)
MFDLTLTFDNGPDAEVTPFVLDTLAVRGIRSTFFVIGCKAELPGGMALVERAHSEGHWIGNHTWTHSVPLGERDEPDLVDAEVVRTQDLIGPFAQKPKLFRPFGGGGNLDRRLLNKRVVRHLCAEGFTCVLWNAVPRDWADPQGWVETALAQVASQPATLMVLHDLPTGAMRLLPDFLDAVTERGGRFRQEFPTDCLPIVDGKIVRPLDEFVTETR